MDNCGIYKIVNPVGKIYVGQSHNIPDRWRSYRKPSFLTKSMQKRIANSIIKYGYDAHLFEVIEYCDDNILQADLDILEIKYMEMFNCLTREHGLNIRGGGSKGKLSPETIEKLRNKIVSQETRDKCSSSLKGKKGWNKGIPRTDEVKLKLSIAHKGNTYRKGFTTSDETKELLRQCNLGKTYSKEVNQKKGTVRTDAQKQKLREFNIKSNITRNKQHSEETLKIISEKVKADRSKKARMGIKIDSSPKKVNKIDPESGKILATYESVMKAAIDNHIGKNHIHAVINKTIFYNSKGEPTIREKAGGFLWEKSTL